MNPKVLRALLCICLCCAILFSSVARPARASSFASWVTNQISWDIGTSAILQGLGVFRDSASDYYDELMSNVKSYLESGGYIRDDLMTAYYFQSPLPQAASFYAFSNAIIEVVRQYLFDNGVVTDSYSGFANSQISAINAAVQNYELAFSFSNPYCIMYQIGNGDLRLGCSKYPFTLGSDGIYRSYSNGAPQSFKIYTVYSDRFYAHQGFHTDFDPVGNSVRLFRGSNPVTTYNPITLGTIAPPGTLFSSAYPQWLEHQCELEDGTTETVVQIGLGNTQAEMESLTQEQIWSGQGTLQIPEQGQVSTPVTLPGWLQQGLDNLRLGLQDILSTLKQLPQLLAQELAKIFVPSQDYISVKVEALRGEFGFIDSVIATGEFIRDSISGDSGPPVIYVDLGRAPSGNYGSQRVLLTDFSWYAPYKGQVNTVLSAALWAFFGWKVFLNLPSIIGGESGYISDIAFYESGGYYGGRAKEIRSGRSSRSKEKGGK